jgi:hypothetical protein
MLGRNADPPAVPMAELVRIRSITRGTGQDQALLGAGARFRAAVLAASCSSRRNWARRLRRGPPESPPWPLLGADLAAGLALLLALGDGEAELADR